MAALKTQLKAIEGGNRPKIVTVYNYEKRQGWKPAKGDKGKFVPKQAYTPRQIAERFANGLHTLVDKVALYDNGTEVIKNFDKLDLTEKHAILKRIETNILQKRHDAQVAAKKKNEELFQKAVMEEIKKREDAAKTDANQNTDNKK